MEMRLRLLALGWMMACAAVGVAFTFRGSPLLAQAAYAAAVFPQILVEWNFPKQFSWWEVRRATRFLLITAYAMAALLVVDLLFSAFIAAVILYIMAVKFHAPLILKYFSMLINMLLWSYYIWLLLMHKKPPPKKRRRAAAKTRAPRWTWRPQPLSRRRLPPSRAFCLPLVARPCHHPAAAHGSILLRRAPPPSPPRRFAFLMRRPRWPRSETYIQRSIKI